MNCDWLAQFDRRLIARRLQYADAIIGSSEYLTSHVRLRFPQYADRCVTIFNGTDVYPLSNGYHLSSPRRRGKRFIFVGRVSPEKGVHVLLEAFKLVVNRESEAELGIVGSAQIPPLSFIVEVHKDPVVRGLRRFYSSDYMAYVQDQASTIPGNRVSFSGFVPHNELPILLREADIFVQPSVWDEPFGMPVVEAMAAGLPVVSSRSGGLREIIVDGKTGLLVEPNDPSALAEGMLRLGADDRIARDMGLAGAIRAQELFDWEKVTGKLSSVYHSLDSRFPDSSLSSA